MGSGEQSNFAGDGPDIGWPAAIRALAVFKYHFPHFGVFQFMENELHVPCPVGVVFLRKRDYGLGLDRVQLLLPGALIRNKDGLANGRRSEILDGLAQ